MIDSDMFFKTHEGPMSTPPPNATIRRALSKWSRSIPESEKVPSERNEAALLAAFPFEEAKAEAESVSQVADPTRGCEHPVDYWLRNRTDIHAIMRHAFERGMDWLIEDLEEHRDSIAQQAACVVALTNGEHPEVVERARRQNMADAIWGAGELADG